MISDKHLFNKKVPGKYRTALRKNLTSAEASLWNLLKARQVSGHKFRRQHSIGNFIVDFCCPMKNQPPRHSFVVPPLLQKEGRVPSGI
jgi:hypothetical protein